MKAKALYTILSKKAKDGEILFVDTFSFKAPKTAEAKEILKSLSTVKGFERLSTKRNNAAYIALNGKDQNVVKSFNNFSNVEIDSVTNINPVSLLNHKYLVIADPESAVSFIAGKLAKK